MNNELDGFVLKSDVIKILTNGGSIEDIRKMTLVTKEDIEKYFSQKNEMCSSYEELTRKRYLYDRYTGRPDGFFEETYGVCNGTRERDEVGCKGDRCSKECFYNIHKG